MAVQTMSADEAYRMLEDLRKRMMEMVDSIDDAKMRVAAREAMEQALSDKAIKLEMSLLQKAQDNIAFTVNTYTNQLLDSKGRVLTSKPPQ